MTGPATSPQSEQPHYGPPAADGDTKEFSRPRLDDQTALMNPGPGFRVGWRGYDRGAVDMYRARVESDLAATRGAHERAVRAHAQAAERLHATQTELARLRARPTDNPTALSERLRE